MGIKQKIEGRKTFMELATPPTFYQINRRCPDKCKFVKNPMNIIDLLAVLPWVNTSIFLLILYCLLITTFPPRSGIMWALLWCEPALERANSPRCWKTQRVKKQSIMNYAQVRRIAQFFRIMRIVRIFKVKMFVLRISSLSNIARIANAVQVTIWV